MGDLNFVLDTAATATTSTIDATAIRRIAHVRVHSRRLSNSAVGIVGRWIAVSSITTSKRRQLRVATGWATI